MTLTRLVILCPKSDGFARNLPGMLVSRLITGCKMWVFLSSGLPGADRAGHNASDSARYPSYPSLFLKTLFYLPRFHSSSRLPDIAPCCVPCQDHHARRLVRPLSVLAPLTRRSIMTQVGSVLFSSIFMVGSISLFFSRLCC